MTHGLSHTRLYEVWASMKARCSGKSKNIKYATYKRKGIRVCDEWLTNFLKFKEWALSNGYCVGLQIDRINNDGNYEPSNCRFVTNRENSNNRGNKVMVKYKNKIASLNDLINEKNLSKYHYNVRQRIQRGWSVEDALDTPIKEYKNANKSLS